MAELGMPYLSVYGAAKGFDLCFSKALRREMLLERRDVEVLGIMTATVTSVSHETSKSTLRMPDATSFAKAALDRVGCGEDVVAAWWFQGIVWSVLSMLPLSFVDKAVIGGVRDDMKRREKNA